MTRMNWNQWLSYEGDELLTWLNDCEAAAKRAIHGIWLFLVVTIPELCRQFLSWLRERFLYALRVATRLGRLAGLALFWLLIVIGPLAIYPGWMTTAWFAVALLASWLGLQRQIKRRPRVSGSVKGVCNGR